MRPFTWPVESDSVRLIRSEEHTSELQSRQYLVCRLLLEKKQNSVARRRIPPFNTTVTGDTTVIFVFGRITTLERHRSPSIPSTATRRTYVTILNLERY